MAGLSVFLPWTLNDLLESALSSGPPFKRQQGAVLFCDVAGFTPLTEALQVLGKEGAEALTRILNAYFTTMISIIEEEGGDVLRFGGDAMTVFFPADSHGRSLNAAWRMMEAMSAFAAMETRAGSYGISMKIGAAFGEVQLGILGSEETGRDYYAMGAPLDDSAEAEHHAAAGLIVIHPTFRAGMGKGFLIEDLEGGFARVTRRSPGRPHALPGEGREEFRGDPAEAAGPRPSPSGPPADPEWQEPCREPSVTLPDRKVLPENLLARVVPRYLAERAGEGVLGEHRGAAVLFLSFALQPSAGAGSPGGSEDGWRFHRILDSLYRAFAAAAERYGGTVNKVDLGDKGAKALLLFGCPYAIENKEEMAVLAALDLMGLSKEAPLKMGLTSAPLFSGPIGSPTRREFTVMGDGVNLAARLMQAAQPGQLLCDSGATGSASKSLRFSALGKIAVKGKKEPVAIFAPTGERGDREEEGLGPLVEREAPCGAITSYLLKGGNPIALIGESGCGKTALALRAAAEAKMVRMPCTRVVLAPYRQDRPFSAWRGVVRSLVGLQKGDSTEKARDARDKALIHEPTGYRPLLNPLLGLPEEITPALKNLSPKERKDLAFAILGRLLAAGGERLILLDGLQWADPLSLDLLSFLLQDPETLPWRLIVSLRPGYPEAERAAAAMTSTVLTPLSSHGICLFLHNRHGLVNLPSKVLAWFASRSRGNPAVASALVAALDAAGLLSRDVHGTRVDEDRLFASAFPDTLEGLYLQRVDRLQREEREVLQWASILGTSVSLHLLKRIGNFREEGLKGALDALRSQGLLESDSWGERPYARFHDTLLRDAVYNALPFSLKREGHLRTARFLEAQGEENPALWPTLAHHFEQAAEEGKARRYHRLAGRAAVSRYDNLTALKHLEYVCGKITPDSEDIEDAFALMDVYGFLGRWGDARPILERVRALEEPLGAARRARLQNYISHDLFSRQDWDGVERALGEGIRLAEEAGDLTLQGRGLVNLVGRLYGPTGRLDEARDSLEKALHLPKAPGQSVWRTVAAMNLGAVLKHLGRRREAMVILREAYRDAVVKRLGLQRIMIADNLSALLFEDGKFLQAIAWGKRASEGSDRFSIRRAAIYARYNLSMAYLASGWPQEALALLEQVALGAAKQSEPQMRGSALQGLSQALLSEGDLAKAVFSSVQALRIFKEIQNARDYKFTLIGVGSLFYALADRAGAEEFWKKEDASEYLRRTPGDAVADASLARLDQWISFEKPWRVPDGFLSQENRSCEETLERLLWVCEIALDEGKGDIAQDYLPKALEALRTRPYFDARLRILRLEAHTGEGLAPTRKREALTLLRRSMGGVWGLRLLCLLWMQEGHAARARNLRQSALRHLYFTHLHSPAWAWKRIAAFPEVRAVLVGRDEKRGGKARVGPFMASCKRERA